MNSFISWIGGKKLLRKKIIEQFPNAIERYIEVFGGAGWVLFAKEKHAPTEVYNDVNSNLVNLYRCVKYHPDALQKELDGILMSRELFFDAIQDVAAVDFLTIASGRLKSVIVENLDFEHLIRTYDRPEALFYCDPPYYDAEKYYPDRFQPEDHQRLYAVLKNIKGKFVLSYNHCPEIRNMYKSYNIIEVDRSDNLVTKKQSRKYQELIIKNF